MSAVEQLEHGVRVRCADGTEIVCKPLTLKAAKQILEFWNQRFAPAPPVSDPPTDAEGRALTAHFVAVAKARVETVKVFAACYPELEDRISPGDAELLIPDFFWGATGAIVPAPAGAILPSPPTGTPPSATTAPSGESSPT